LCNGDSYLETSSRYLWEINNRLACWSALVLWKGFLKLKVINSMSDKNVNSTISGGMSFKLMLQIYIYNVGFWLNGLHQEYMCTKMKTIVNTPPLEQFQNLIETDAIFIL